MIPRSDVPAETLRESLGIGPRGPVGPVGPPLLHGTPAARVVTGIGRAIVGLGGALIIAGILIASGSIDAYLERAAENVASSITELERETLILKLCEGAGGSAGSISATVHVDDEGRRTCSVSESGRPVLVLVGRKP